MKFFDIEQIIFGVVAKYLNLNNGMKFILKISVNLDI